MNNVDLNILQQMTLDANAVRSTKEIFVVLNKMATLLANSLIKLEAGDELLSNRIGDLNKFSNYGFIPVATIDINGFAFSPVKAPDGKLLATSYFNDNGDIITQYMLNNVNTYKLVIAYFTAATSIQSIIITNINNYPNSSNYTNLVNFKLPAVIPPLPVDHLGNTHLPSDFGTFGKGISNLVDYLLENGITGAPPVDLTGINTQLATLTNEVTQLTSNLIAENTRAVNAELALSNLIKNLPATPNTLLPNQVNYTIDINSGVNEVVSVNINGVLTTITTQNFIIPGDADPARPILVFDNNTLLTAGIDYGVSEVREALNLQLYKVYTPGTDNLSITYDALANPDMQTVTLSLPSARGTMILNGNALVSPATLSLKNGSYPITINSNVPGVSFLGNGSSGRGVSFSMGGGKIYLNVRGDGYVTFSM